MGIRDIHIMIFKVPIMLAVLFPTPSQLRSLFCSRFLSISNNILIRSEICTYFIDKTSYGHTRLRYSLKVRKILSGFHLAIKIRGGSAKNE